MRSRTATRARRKLRTVAVALSCVLLAFAIVTGLFQANTRYFYCASMGMMHEDPCAAAAAAQRDEQPPATPATNPTDALFRTPFTCCSTGVLGTIPSSTALAELRVEPAQLVAIVALPSPIDSWKRASADATEPPRAHRSRIPPRPARALRAQSMVFLT